MAAARAEEGRMEGGGGELWEVQWQRQRRGRGPGAGGGILLRPLRYRIQDAAPQFCLAHKCAGPYMLPLGLCVGAGSDGLSVVTGSQLSFKPAEADVAAVSGAGGGWVVAGGLWTSQSGKRQRKFLRRTGSAGGSQGGGVRQTGVHGVSG